MSIPCHKNILSGASSVFEAMIGNKKNKEAVEGEVDMNISAEVGRAFVEFIYTAKLDKEILAKEAVSFLELGDKYQMPGLKELAEEEMMTQLSRENMVKLLAISDLYRAKELREAAIKFTKLRYALKKKPILFGNFSQHGGGVFPNPKTFVNLPSIFLYAKFILRC